MAPNSVPPSDEAEDPIDLLLAEGLRPRDLIAHALLAVEWLANHRRDSFRLCYFGQDGAVVVEDVTAAGLIRRSGELGWNPNTELPSAEEPGHMFDEAIYHTRRGVHWYATACTDTTEMLPLAFPQREIEASRKRDEKLYGPEQQARIAKRRDQYRKAKQAEKERAATAELAAAVDLAASDFMHQAEQADKPITDATARRKAWKHVRKCDDWIYHLLLKRLRAATKEAL